jgi:DNA-binding CsgD family transcriptional regulator/PAS domain-containing protein
MHESIDGGKSLGALVQRVYDAALDDRWWAGLADSIARTFASSSTVLKAQHADSSVQLMETTENLVVAPRNQALADHWHAHDLWVERSVAHGMSRVITNRDLIADAEFERTAFYYDWCRQLDIYHMIGAVFPIDTDTIGVLGVHREQGAGHFAQRDRRRVTAFLPHLQRALRIRHRLQGAAQVHAALFGALDRLVVGVAVVDYQGRLLYANPLAERVLRSGAGGIGLRGGRVHLRDIQLGARLQRALRAAVRSEVDTLGDFTGAMALPRPGRLPITLLTAPLRNAALGAPAALLFIRDPEQAAPAHDVLRELFGLTRTEAAIAAALATGLAPDAIAADFGIGIGTVRSHLKGILAKTGTRRQGELVALIGSSVAGIVDTAR